MRLASRGRKAQTNAHNLTGCFFGCVMIVSALGCLLLVYKMFRDPTQDMVAFTNAAFLAVVALSALAFTYAQALPAGQKEVRTKLIDAGEWCILAALTAGLSAIIRYAVITSAYDSLFDANQAGPREQTKVVLLFVALLLLMLAVVTAHFSFWEVLEARRTRRSQADIFQPPPPPTPPTATGS